MPIDTVKAREHHGSSSYDLTIPAEVVKEYDLRIGDVFQVTAECEEEDGEVVITYKRVFEQPDSEE